MSTTARALIEPTANLIYIFQPTPEPIQAVEHRHLTVDRLLIPPRMINDKPWTMGYFVRIANLPFWTDEILAHHCFRSWDGKYYDENAQMLDAPLQPVGEWGLASYRVIDDDISAALQIPPAED